MATKRQLGYRSYRVFRLHASYRIKSWPRSFFKAPIDIRTATLVGKRRGIAISATVIYSGSNRRINIRKWQAKHTSRSTHNTTLPYDNRVGALRLGQRRRSRCTLPRILSFYHSHYDARIYGTLSATYWNTDGQSPRIDFPRDDFCGTVLKPLFIAGGGPVLPIRIFALSQGSEIFICPRDFEIRNASTIIRSITSAPYGPSIIFQSIESLQLSSSHRRQEQNNCNFNGDHLGAGIAIPNLFTNLLTEIFAVSLDEVAQVVR